MSRTLDEEEKNVFGGPKAVGQNRMSWTEEQEPKRPNDEAQIRASQDVESIAAQSLAGNQLPPAPDGGLHAWLKVFGGFLVYINIWYGSSKHYFKKSYSKFVIGGSLSHTGLSSHTIPSRSSRMSLRLLSLG